MPFKLSKSAKLKLIISPDDVKVYRVVWVDSSAVDMWVHFEHTKEFTPCVVESTGWWVSDEADYIVIALSKSNNSLFGSCLTIPKGCIKQMSEV